MNLMFVKIHIFSVYVFLHTLNSQLLSRISVTPTYTTYVVVSDNIVTLPVSLNIPV